MNCITTICCEKAECCSYMNSCPVCEILSRFSCGEGEANVCAVVFLLCNFRWQVTVNRDAATEQQLCFRMKASNFPGYRFEAFKEVSNIMMYFIISHLNCT